VNKSGNILLPALLTCVLLFSSCENNQWFRSEKDLKNKIQGSWKRQFFTSLPNPDLGLNFNEEYWTFKEGDVFRMRIEGSLTDTIDKGIYTIDAKWFSSYLKMEGFSTDTTGAFNNKFTIVELDKDVLLIATDVPRGGIAQYEFSRKN
jgi:hypothetical protein